MKRGPHERNFTVFHKRAILGVRAAVVAMRNGLHSFVSTNATARLPALEGTARRASSALVARDLNMSESTAFATRRVAWSASPAARASVCSAMKKALIVDSQTPAYVATPTLPYVRTMFDSQVFVPFAGVAGAAPALLAVLLLAVLLLAVLLLVVLPPAPVLERRNLHPRVCDAMRVHAARWASIVVLCLPLERWLRTLRSTSLSRMEARCWQPGVSERRKQERGKPRTREGAENPVSNRAQPEGPPPQAPRVWGQEYKSELYLIFHCTLTDSKARERQPVS
jgi:hypothetical protein